jgi:hypothetical protein
VSSVSSSLRPLGPGAIILDKVWFAAVILDQVNMWTTLDDVLPATKTIIDQVNLP